MYAGYAGRREKTGGSSVHSTMFVVTSITARTTARRAILISIPGRLLRYPHRPFGESFSLGLLSTEFHSKHASFSGQSFTCAEALRDHQVRMKNKIHICGIWYILFRSHREFRLSDIQQWENLHKLRQPKTTRGEEALQLKVWKPYILRFH